MQFGPERVIGDVGIPGDSAGVSQRDFFPLGELVRVGEVEQFVILLFGETLPSSLDGALHASIFALDRFRDVDPAELFESVVDDTVAKSELPSLREGADDVGHMGAYRLAFRTRRALAAGAFEIAFDFRIGDFIRIDVRNSRHGSPLSCVNPKLEMPNKHSASSF